jgi:hypothetical protein
MFVAEFIVEYSSHASNILLDSFSYAQQNYFLHLGIIKIYLPFHPHIFGYVI